QALRLEAVDVPSRQRLAELVDQPRLADAGLAAEPDDLALTADRRRQAALEQLELVLAADEGDHPGPGPEARPLAADQQLGRRAAGRTSAGRQAEPAREQRRRHRAHRDAVERRPLDQLVEQRPQVPALVHVELDAAAGEADQRRRGVHPELDGDLAALVAAGALDGL